MAGDDDSTRESRALIDLARTTTLDLYTLLDLTPSTTTSSTLKKAWRLAALKHHPDKNRGNEAAAADRLAEVRQALDILSDDAARAVYDDKQRAAREKKERSEAMEGKRRKMKEDLERRESASWSPAGLAGLKRKAAESQTPQQKREAKIRGLADEAARRRSMMMEERRKERDKVVNGEDDDPFVDKVKAKVEGEGVNGAATSTPSRFSKSAGSNGTASPSFSFSAKSTPSKGGVASSGAGKGGALYEATMQRLREMEKKRLEEQIRREEASLEAAQEAAS